MGDKRPPGATSVPPKGRQASTPTVKVGDKTVPGAQMAVNTFLVLVVVIAVVIVFMYK